MADEKALYRYEPLQVIQQMQAEWKDENQLNYAVKGRPAFAFVDVFLKQTQKVVGDAGTMLWMDGEVPMETTCHGGCWAAFYRTCSGETCCQNIFTGAGKVSFGRHLPGDLLPFAVTPGNGWIISRQSYVCGSFNCVVSSRFAGCGMMLCGGEGAFLTKVTTLEGQGMFFGGNYGSLERHEIPAGKVFFVDHGLFFAAHESTQISMGIVGNVVGFCCGGEGFVMRFYGPSVVYTKSRDPARMFDYSQQRKSRSRAQAGGGAGGGAAVGLSVNL